jgi:hypothetical protein
MFNLPGKVYLPPVSREDFAAVVLTAKTSVGPEDIKEHIKWTA